MSKIFKKIRKVSVYILGTIVLLGYKSKAWAIDSVAPDYGVLNVAQPVYGINSEPVLQTKGAVSKVMELGAVVVLGVSVILIGLFVYMVIKLKNRKKND
jgi:hypothetical protein